MADRTRTITLRINDQFSRELKEFTRQMDAATQSTERLGQTAAGGGRWGGFKQAAQDLFFMGQSAMMVANQFSAMLGKVNELAQIGIGAERAKLALTALAGSAEQASVWIEAVNKGAHGALTEGEAAAQAYRLMRFGLADTAEEAQRFIDVVSKIALINPQLGGTEEAISQIQLTLSNMSFMRLDQLGISAGQVRKRMEELKQTTAALSNEEAFRIAVMEQLGKQADMLGDDFVELDNAQKRVAAWWRGFKEDVGLRAAQGLEGLAEGVLGLYDALNKLGAQEFTVRLTVAVGYQILGDLGKQIAKAADERVEARRQIGDIQGPAAYYQTEEFVNNAVEWFTDLFTGRKSGGIRPMSPPLAPQSPISYPPGETLEEALANALEDALFGELPMSMMPTPQVPMSMAPPGTFIIRPSSIPVGGRDSMGQWEIIPSQIPIGGRDAMRPAGVYPAWAYMSLPPSGTPLPPVIEPPVQTKGAMLWTQMQTLKSYQAAANIIPTLFGGRHQLGINYRVRGIIDDALGGLQGYIPKLLKVRDAVGEIAGRWGDVAKAAFDAIRPAERYASLAEKFGLDPHTFDLDVYDRMKTALEEAEVPADAMAEAMRRFEHQTGIANAQSEIFDVQMGLLADKLKMGELSAKGYVDAVTRLSSIDLSGIQAMMGPLAQMDMDTYLTVLDRISGAGYDQLMRANNLPYLVQGAVSNIQAALFGGEKEEVTPAGQASPLQPLIQDFETLSSRFANVEKDWGEPVITFQNIATGEFETMKVNATDNITDIAKELNALTMGNYEVKVKIIPSVIPIGGRDSQAGGGASTGEVYDAVVSESSRRNNPILANMGSP